MSEDKKKCVRCNGSGNISCPACSGSGQTQVIEEGKNQNLKIVNCAACRGSGKKTCGSCGGSGKN